MTTSLIRLDGRIQKATIDGTSLVGAAKTVMRVPEWRRNTFDDNGVGFAVVGDGHYLALLCVGAVCCFLA